MTLQICIFSTYYCESIVIFQFMVIVIPVLLYFCITNHTNTGEDLSYALSLLSNPFFLNK